MTLLTPDLLEVADTEPVPPSRRRRGLPGWLRRPTGALGAAWLVVIVVASFSAPLWRPYPVDEQDLANRLSGPSSDHWLGTDEVGRDLLSRIASAGAEPLLAAALTVAVAFLLGTGLALVAAERGPRVEGVTSRVAEILQSLPSTILLLAVIGAVGVNTFIVMGVLGVLISGAVYRIMLKVAQSVRQRLYVDAARVNGLPSLLVNLRHVLPSMATVIAVQAAQVFGIALLVQAGLAFLGFGPAEPQPSWGSMIQKASQHVYDAPWLMVPTGLVLALTVVAANGLADTIAERAAGAPAPLRTPRRPSPVVPADLPPADPAAVLEVRELSVAVDGGPALVSDVSFALRPGQVLGLVGESGCGKTMTARSLMGLLPDGVSVSGGSVRWQGRELVGAPEKEVAAVRGRGMALISQEPMVALHPLFTVAHQLVQPLRRMRGVGAGEARRIAAELLSQVGIVDAERVLASHPHELSGGMAQRVCIALALTGEPELLIADEPTTALDVTVQAEILSLLRSLVAETGLAVVLVTHDLGVVADICDDVAVMYAGTVVESGTTARVLEAPAHPYTMALLGADPHVPEGEPVPQRLASIAGTVPAPGSWPEGCRFAGRCPFVTDACRRPFPVQPAHGAGEVLCVRVDDLARAHAGWDAGMAGTGPLSAVPGEPGTASTAGALA